MNIIPKDAVRPLVFLDMDGVITNFAAAYTEIPELEDGKKFHRAVTEFKIFERLNWMPNGEWLVGLLDMLDCDVEILSSTGTHNPGVSMLAATQKATWLDKNGLEFPQHFVNTWAHKQHFAQPWTIMIDDRADVIETFRAKGGLGVLYKDSDWHDMDYKIRQAVVRAKQIIELGRK